MAKPSAERIAGCPLAWSVPVVVHTADSCVAQRMEWSTTGCAPPYDTDPALSCFESSILRCLLELFSSSSSFRSLSSRCSSAAAKQTHAPARRGRMVVRLAVAFLHVCGSHGACLSRCSCAAVPPHSTRRGSEGDESPSSASTMGTRRGACVRACVRVSVVRACVHAPE